MPFTLPAPDGNGLAKKRENQEVTDRNSLLYEHGNTLGRHQAEGESRSEVP